MLIACAKTAPILWIDLGVGPKLPSNILLEKMLGQWLVLSSFTNWLWKKNKKILVTPLFNQAMGIWDINSLSHPFWIISFLPKSQVLVVKFLHVQIQIPRYGPSGCSDGAPAEVLQVACDWSIPCDTRIVNQGSRANEPTKRDPIDFFVGL